MYRRYDTINQEVIKQKWMNMKNPFGVYVHSPFCPSICKFCIYAGVKTNDNQYAKYYNDYLPKVIEFYNPILETKSNLIDSWFFGGGTPSLMTADILYKILNSLSGFKEHSAEKTFEIHPGAYNIEILDVLKEFNFHTMILCQQTLDQQTLISQNRVPSDLENLILLSNECKKRDFNIGVDLISFLNKKDSDEQILKDDLDNLYNNVLPDQMSVQTIYQNKEFTAKTISAVFDSKFIAEKKYFIEDWKAAELSEDELSDNEYMKKYFLKTNKSLKCFRLFKTDKDIDFKLVDYMDPAWSHGFKANDNTLAIGAFKNPFTQTHSNINEFNYIEHNKDNSAPIFKFVSSSYYGEIDYLFSIFKKAGEPPTDVVFDIKTQFHTEKQIPFFLEHKIEIVENNAKHIKYLNNVLYFMEEEKKQILNKLHDNSNNLEVLYYV